MEEEHVLQEKRLDDLILRYTAREGLIWQDVLARTERAEVDLRFIMDKDTTENRRMAAEEWKPESLAGSRRTGLCALLRRSAEADEAGELLPEGKELYGCCGNYDSALTVEQGRLVYRITACSPGSGGQARIDLGAATASRGKKMGEAVWRFEDRWLQAFVWVIKHMYIESGGYEDWSPEDGEEE